MESKTLTVVLPVYNGEKYIKRALECLQNQTWNNFNILIINDASTDDTNSILESYAKRNPKISVINLSQNMGVSYCRNLGIKTCKTEYITFLDHDDWVDLGTYENCLKVIQNDIDIAIFGLNYEYIDLDVSEKKYIYNKNFTITGEYGLKIYGHTIKDSFKITPIVNNKIYKLKFLINNSLYFNEQVRYQEDDIFTFEVLMYAQKVMFIPNSQYHYLQNPKSVIHQVSDFSVENFIMAYETLKNFLKTQACFEKYKNEFYLKFKSSLKGTIHRITQYGKSQTEIQHLLALLYKKLMEVVEIEEFFSYCDLKCF